MSTKSFQIASIAKPLEILFGPSQIDEGQKARSIKCYIDDVNQIESLMELDDSLISLDGSRRVVRLKLWQDAEINIRAVIR
jgi:hypothetical protein